MKIEVFHHLMDIFPEFEQKVFWSLKILFPTYPQYRSIRRPNSIQLWPKMTDKQYRSYSYFFDTAISQPILMIQKTSWIKFCWTYPGFKGRSVIRPSSFRYKAIWWPYNGTYGLITDTRLWPYISRSTQFFKTPKGLVSDIWPWPYNRGNTV